MRLPVLEPLLITFCDAGTFLETVTFLVVGLLMLSKSHDLLERFLLKALSVNLVSIILAIELVLVSVIKGWEVWKSCVPIVDLVRFGVGETKSCRRRFAVDVGMIGCDEDVLR